MVTSHGDLVTRPRHPRRCQPLLSRLRRMNFAPVFLAVQDVPLRDEDGLGQFQLIVDLPRIKWRGEVDFEHLDEQERAYMEKIKERLC